MKRFKQLFRHNPENGVYGDCMRTVLACLLEVAPEDIKHIGKEEFEDRQKFNDHFKNALLELGYVEVVTSYRCPLDQVLYTQSQLNPDVYFMLYGTSKNGTNHVVIGCNNELIWDPSLDDTGIIGPCDDGFFYVGYLTSIQFMRRELQ